MSNEKKYIIVRHNRDGSINSYFGGNQIDYPPYNKMIPSVWYNIIDKASTFTRSEAEKMYAIVMAYYNAMFNANIMSIANIKIHEYIPATVGVEVKSERDEILDRQIDEANATIERLRNERDEARILYCETIALRSDMAKQLAKRMGWDCYDEENGT